jgi:hypothetical protein
LVTGPTNCVAYNKPDMLIVDKNGKKGCAVEFGRTIKGNLKKQRERERENK